MKRKLTDERVVRILARRFRYTVKVNREELPCWRSERRCIVTSCETIQYTASEWKHHMWLTSRDWIHGMVACLTDREVSLFRKHLLARRTIGGKKCGEFFWLMTVAEPRDFAYALAKAIIECGNEKGNL